MATQLVTASPSLIQARISELEDLLNEEKALLALAQRPVEPVEKDAVIRFRKYDQQYSFAAIAAGKNTFGHKLWYITQDGSRTSRQGHAPKLWMDLLQWIGQRNWDTIEVLQ